MCQRDETKLTTERRRASSLSPFEKVIGFSRAIRVGERICVSGTGPVWPNGSCEPDAAAQAVRCFEIIADSLSSLGATLDDVVRTRIYLTSSGDAGAVGAVHASMVGTARPAATMVVVAALLDPRWKVEIEAEAVADSG